MAAETILFVLTATIEVIMELCPDDVREAPRYAAHRTVAAVTKSVAPTTACRD